MCKYEGFMINTKYDEMIPDIVLLSLQTNPVWKHQIKSKQHPFFHSLVFLLTFSNLFHATVRQKKSYDNKT